MSFLMTYKNFFYKMWNFNKNLYIITFNHLRILLVLPLTKEKRLLKNLSI